MKLTSKTVKVGTRKINCSVTREQIEDLEILFGKYYVYETKSDREKQILKDNVKIKQEYESIISYKITKIQLRKIKVGLINGIEDFILLEEIIRNSKIHENDDIASMEELLVKELTKSINQEILNKLHHLGSENKDS